MPNRPWLNIQANDTVVVELQAEPRETEFSNKQGEAYTKWLYDVLHNGTEKTIGATKGLHNTLESVSPRAGDVIAITRTGTGLNTRWAVAFERGQDASMPAASTNVRPGATIDDLWSTYDAMVEMVKQRDPDAMNPEIVAASLTHTVLGLGIRFPGFGSDKGEAGASVAGEGDHVAFVRKMMRESGIPESVWDRMAARLFGEHITTLDDATREDAKMLYAFTNKGQNPEFIEEEYEKMVADNTPGDDDEDEDLPF